MFFGEYSHQIDGNNRIRIPTPFKSELGGAFYLSKGLDKIINILPSKIVEAQLEKLQAISEFDEEGQEALLEYTSTVFPAEEDGQGRVRIPKELVDFAELTKDVVTVGMGNKLSLMTKELREEKRKKRSHSEIMSIIDKKLKD